mmetsp:Transcript_65603/g.137131  ORF Transcript_65603/g.137131 Transcript_65603/m.137131 type:complete len:492 (+) Transcript_65603:88-1563(+)
MISVPGHHGLRSSSSLLSTLRSASRSSRSITSVAASTWLPRRTSARSRAPAAGAAAHRALSASHPSSLRTPQWSPIALLGAPQQVRHLNRACGLVGYPNVGKSTLFNAFVGSTVAAAENFPFCTIEPNNVKLGVPDERLEQLAKTCGALKVVPGTVEIRDIAGLIKGASSGAGMGNAFLSQIRGVQVILHVVRCFSNADIIHVEDPVNIDPVKEYESILEELIIADLEMADRRLPALRKRATNNREAEKLLPVYENVLKVLQAGRPARVALGGLGGGVPSNDDFLTQLITAKPVVVLANVSPEDAATGNAYSERLAKHIADSEAAAMAEFASQDAAKGSKTAAGDASCPLAARRCVVVSAPLEAEVAALDDEEFQKEYLESYGLKEGLRALPRVLAEGQSLLGLISYLTVGEQEARAWFVPKGSRAAEAAGAIHSDFVKNFEQADVWRYEDIVRLGGKAACKKEGLVKHKGKDYEVQDGDVMEFRIKGGRS